MLFNPLNLSLWRFPASLILGLLFIGILWLLFHYYRQKRICRFLTSPALAILSSILIALMLALEGIWGIDLYRTVPFIVLALLFMTSLGVTTIKRIYYNPRLGFLCNHVGLFLIVWGMFFGAPDYFQAHMVVYKNQKESIAYSENQQTIPLPYYISLDNFEVEYYDDMKTVRQYHSKLNIEDTIYDICVNKPAFHKGYHIYQSAYDRENENYVVLQVVRDPWLWVVYIGIVMLAIGSMLLIFKPL